MTRKYLQAGIQLLLTQHPQVPTFRLTLAEIMDLDLDQFVAFYDEQVDRYMRAKTR